MNLAVEKGIKKNILFDSEKEYVFKVAFDDNSQVEKVYVVSTKAGDSRRIEALLNKEGTEFVTSGKFESGYIPGSVSVEYVVKGKGIVFSDAIETPEFDNLWQNAGVTNKNSSDGIEKATVILNNSEMTRIDVANYTETITEDINLDRYTEITDTNGNKVYIDVNSDDYKNIIVEMADMVNMKKNKYVLTIDLDKENQMTSINDVLADVEKFILNNGKKADVNLVKSIVLNYEKDDKVDDDDYINGIDDIGGNDTESTVDLYAVNVEYINNARLSNYAYTLLTKVFAKAPDVNFTNKEMVTNALILFTENQLAATGVDLYQVIDKESIGSYYDANYMTKISGIVFEGTKEFPLNGVELTAKYSSTETGTYTEWDGSLYEQPNKVTTGEDGIYLWNLPIGYYKFVSVLDGYAQATTSSRISSSDDVVEISMTSMEAPEVESVQVYEQYTVIKFNKPMKKNTVNNIRINNNENSVHYNIKSVNPTYVNNNEVASEFILAYTGNNEARVGRNYSVDIPTSVVSFANIPVNEYNKDMQCMSDGVKLNVQTNISLYMGEEYKLEYSVKNCDTNKLTTNYSGINNDSILDVGNFVQQTETEAGYLDIQTLGSVGTSYITLTLTEYGITKTISIDVSIPNSTSKILVRNISEDSSEKTITCDFYNNTASEQKFKGIAAIYDSGYKLIGVKDIDVELSKHKIKTEAFEFDKAWSSYKIFAWDSYKTMIPLRNMN